MKRFLSDDALEDFLKQNADRFQMRPSDKVWKGISDNLKRRNRRIGWFTGLFMTATAVAGYLLTGTGSPVGTLVSLPAQGSGAKTTARILTLPATGNPGNNTIATNANSLSGLPASAAATPVENRNPDRSHNTGTAPTASARRRRSSNAAVRNNETTESIIIADSYASLSNEPGRNFTDASLQEPYVTERPDLANAPAAENNIPAPLAKGKPGRVSLQFFFTPTVSYRSLSENKDYTTAFPQNSADPNYAALYNINDAVTHKPSIGLEVGLTAKYALDRNVKIQGGLQFNMSRYEVQAFDNYTPQVATMAYNGGGSTARATSYSNISGEGRKDWLQNMYFQVSAPIGVELRLAGNSKTQFGVASTIQPTYILSDRVYMLSTDYKNYAEVPWLVRRFNVNTALSTYVGYSTGKLNWQVGPQVRYQLMSSFVKKYPLKENLFDFGLRIGVSFNKGGR